MGSTKVVLTSKYFNFIFKHIQGHIFEGRDIWVVSQHTSLLRGGVSSGDESKFGNLTGTYHGVLVAFY